MNNIAHNLAEALRLISFASMDRGARDTAREALAAYEQAQAEPHTVDCIGLALDLEARAKTVESQTTQRAMEAAAHGLRLLAATLAQAEPWQPIETAPKDGSVIVLSRGQQAFAGYWGEGLYTTGWLASGSTLVVAFSNINPPTHWMPLPQPPKEQP